MVNALNLAATLRKINEDSPKSDSLFLELEIVPGDIFQIDESMLNTLCNELQDGVGLTECGQIDVLPYGRSRTAKIENGRLSTTIEVLKGLKLGRRSFASTDDVIKATKAGIIQDFSIVLVDVLCECDCCNIPLSSNYQECCEHGPGQKTEDSEDPFTYTIKKGKALAVSAEPFRMMDNDNIQLLSQDWKLRMENLEEGLEQFIENIATGIIKPHAAPALGSPILTKSDPRARKMPRNLPNRFRSKSKDI